MLFIVYIFPRNIFSVHKKALRKLSVLWGVQKNEKDKNGMMFPHQTPPKKTQNKEGSKLIEFIVSACAKTQHISYNLYCFL